MGAIPASYFQYYYYKDDLLAALQARPTTRAQDIMAGVAGYWEHYREQAASDALKLDPKRSRGGIHELELAVDVINALFNDRKEVWPVNVPNRGAIADFPDDLVVEVPGYVDRSGITPLAQGHLPRQVAGLVKMLGEYQALAAEAAWAGSRREAIQALASHPLVFSLPKAERSTTRWRRRSAIICPNACSSSMSYVLGVDGGSTKTIALVARCDGTIVGVGRRGCSSIYSAALTEEAALAEAEQAVRAALDAAGARPPDLAAGVFSMCGADWPEDIAFIAGAMQRCGFGRTISVVNDAFGALRAGSEDGTGVVVVCGTGAAIGARAADGRSWHSSFWQEPQGAEDLGRQTLRAVSRAELGIGEPTTLTRGVLEFFGQERVEGVLHQLTARGGRRPAEIGGLGRVLLEEATQGDATARRMVEEHGRALGEYALAAARRVGIELTPFTLVLAGGVLRHSSRLLADALFTRVRASAPEVRPIHSRFEPAVGALFLALEAAGVSVDAPLLERLVPTLPPAAHFAT